MKKFKTFAIQKEIDKDIWLLIPHPFTLDLHDIITEFNKKNIEIFEGYVLVDLETVIGNRRGKFIQLSIVDYKLMRSSLQEFCGSTDRLEKFKIQYYSTLDRKITKHLFPLKIRAELVKSINI